MHINRISPARKFLLGAAASLGLALLSGCTTMELSNMTPPSLPGNPSQIYTFTLRATPKQGTVQKDTVSPKIVIDGQEHDMTRSSLQPDIYDFEYHLPANRDTVAYYFLVDYKVADSNGGLLPREDYTGIASAKIASRYVLTLEVNRGPVGARISVLGRGFTSSDQVAFDGTPVRTVYESPTSVSFFVPAMDTGKNYAVSINGPQGNSNVGTFRIDSSAVNVDPSSVSLMSGQTQNVTFSVENPAPAGGLLLDVTTDVPESVIMPEVVVPEGQTSVSVAITGGKAGTGSLFLKGYGSGEVTIPVTVAPAPAPIAPVPTPTPAKAKKKKTSN